MSNPRNWLWPLALGSLWGVMELVGGTAIYKDNVPHASIWLSGWAFFMLAIARGLVNKPGSSSLAGATAAIFKLVYAAPFYCHLLGIFLLGVIFDITATIMFKEGGFKTRRAMLAGIITSYGSYASFALLITYIVRYKYWISEGLPKVLNHILVGGSLAGILSLVLVPLGLKLGASGESAFAVRPRRAVAWATAAIVFLWMIGNFIG